VGDNVNLSRLLYWDFSSPPTATGLSPSSSQTRLLQPQMIIISSSICWLVLSLCRPWVLPTPHLKGCRFSHMVNWGLVPDLSNGFLAVAVQVFLPYFNLRCWHCTGMSNRSDLHHRYVHNPIQHYCIRLYLQPGNWNDSWEGKSCSWKSSYSARNKPIITGPAISQLDMVSR